MEFRNQNTIFNPENQISNIHIVGCGSTGSFIALNLAKMGIESIKVTDFDKVEEHNIPNQFYREEDIGFSKVDALQDIIVRFTGTSIEIEEKKIDEDYQFDLNLDTIIIVCVDNIETRKLIYKKIKEFPVILIDTRLGGEGYQIYSIGLTNQADKDFYEKVLDKPTKDAPCGQKAIIFCILSLAAEVCRIIKCIDKKEDYPKILKREMEQYRFIKDL